jgi:hypothetical protein
LITKLKYDEYEDTKGVIRIRKSKDRQQNGQKKKGKKDKQRSTKITHRAKDRVTRNLQKLRMLRKIDKTAIIFNDTTYVGALLMIRFKGSYREKGRYGRSIVHLYVPYLGRSVFPIVNIECTSNSEITVFRFPDECIYLELQ